jgi:imidazolonepropionase-like amidohydrolase
VLNVRSGSYIKNAAIWVEGERVKAVGREIDVLKEAPTSAQILDLGDVTVLPGLIDCHTHLMERLPDGANAYALNLLMKSEAYRALEGAANARATLEAGFTTVRDVENEGSAYADVALRDAINNGLVAGPRMRLMKLKGVYLVPTLSGLDAHIARKPDDFASVKAQAHLEAMGEAASREKPLWPIFCRLERDQ